MGRCITWALVISIPKDDERTKIGFEFNHGTKYWFNFSNAEDDIIAPKTNTRVEVYETFLTHRISDHFLFKADYIRYNYTWSGSGWHIGEAKKLSSTPLLDSPATTKPTWPQLASRPSSEAQTP